MNKDGAGCLQQVNMHKICSGNGKIIVLLSPKRVWDESIYNECHNKVSKGKPISLVTGSFSSVSFMKKETCMYKDMVSKINEIFFFKEGFENVIT